jgi:hypothetical protein
LQRARKLPAPSRSPHDEWETPVFWFLGVFLAGGGCLLFLIYSLYQPSIYPNPGVAAYQAPPATRLIPLPRKSDAPELPELAAGVPAVLAAEAPSVLTALAQARTSDPPAKREVHPSNRKRPRAEPRAYDQRGFEFTQQWNFRDLNNNRRWVGGPRSWF